MTECQWRSGCAGFLPGMQYKTGSWHHFVDYPSGKLLSFVVVEPLQAEDAGPTPRDVDQAPTQRRLASGAELRRRTSNDVRATTGGWQSASDNSQVNKSGQVMCSLRPICLSGCRRVTLHHVVLKSGRNVTVPKRHTSVSRRLLNLTPVMQITSIRNSEHLFFLLPFGRKV